MFAGLRASAGRDSTDLSTTRVDKPESPFASDSCVIYVMVIGRMARNFRPVPEGGLEAESDSASDGVMSVRSCGAFLPCGLPRNRADAG